MPNPNVEQLENTISAYINSIYKDVPPTEEEFKEKADLMRTSMAVIMPVSDQENDEILKRLNRSCHSACPQMPEFSQRHFAPLA